jgi:hypothetical protein
MGYVPPDDIDPAARALIKHKVRRLVGHYGYTRSDADDLAQELALKAHLAAAKYDPARGALTTFYDRVLENRVRSLAEHATCQRRDRRRERPLDGAAPSAPDPRHDLCLDVRDALAALSEEDRFLARMLQSHDRSRVFRESGMTRGKARAAKVRIAQALATKDLVLTVSAEQPFLDGTRYVTGEGEHHHPNSRHTGRQAEVAGVLHRPHAQRRVAGKGAPQ